MKNNFKITGIFLLLTLFTFQVNAQLVKKMKKTGVKTNHTSFKGCDATLASKTGVVYSVNPGYITAKATSDKVKVMIKKTGGRAKTQVNIYVNGHMKENNTINFKNGNYTTGYKPVILNGVKGKNIKVEIVNQSVGNTFSYTGKILGKRKSVMPNATPVNGTLIGQGFRIVETIPSCTGKTKIIIRRKGGNARGTVRILERGSNGQYNKVLKSVTFEKNEKKKEFIINSNKKLKIELKNISIGNMFKYKINAYAVQ